ncbi:MAG TPA: DUF5686 family protein [Flavobacteriales bacterium]
MHTFTRPSGLRLQLLLLLLLPLALQAQITVTGRIADANSGEVLAFVPMNVDGRTVTMSDIDGRFSFNVPALPVTVRMSYVGYAPQELVFKAAGPHEVKLKQSLTELQALEVRYTENPANRIIRRVYAARKENDGMRYRPYRYKSYSKTIFTGERDTVPAEEVAPDTLMAEVPDTTATDSVDAGTMRFLDTQHLLLIESATQKSFIPPAAEKEEVLAMRVSGLKDPSLLALVAQTKTFSIYDPQITISDKVYLGPIGPSSTSKYFFLLEDTLYQGKDTVFVMSYKPKRGTKFDGLKGLLYVNTDGYAVQNVTAEPVERKGFSVRFQQLHERLSGKAWFPVQLNTFIYMDNVQIGPFKMMGIGRTYLRDIEVDADVARKEVRGPELVTDRMVVKRDDAYWQGLRGGTLDEKELKTYAVIDSIGDTLKFDQKLKWFNAVTSGRLPLGPVDLLLGRLINYNGYEGLRLGAGMATNAKVSRYWSLGGYFGYGFQDKEWKYGGDLTIKPIYGRDLHLKFAYENDVAEMGGMAFKGRSLWLSPEGYRLFYVDRMDRIERFSGEVMTRVGSSLKVWAGTAREQRVNVIGYGFTRPVADGVVVRRNDFLAGSVDLGLRWAFKERLARLPDREVSLGTKWPVFYVQGSRFVEGLWEGEVDGWRVSAMVEKVFKIRLVGDLSVTAFGAMADEALPMGWLYNMRGTNSKGFNVAVPGTFETMRPNEFLSDHMAALHLSHSFGTLLVKGKHFRPRPGVVFNAGIAGLEHPENHEGLSFRTLDDPFYEAGLRVDGILSGMGVAVFYRLGENAFAESKDNLVVKLTYLLTF